MFPNDNLGVLETGSGALSVPAYALSPYSTPVKYTNENSTFLCTPTVDGVLGWGRPFIDETGAPIPNGTFGGDNIVKSVFKSKGEWVSHHKGGAQMFGEIDWRGEYINSRRILLSYHGTSGRHISDGFIYGTDPKHNYVYFQGSILAVAPLPVMGASLYKDALGAYWIIVIVDNGDVGEVVFRKVHSPVSKAYAEANREVLSSRKNLVNPTGWRSAGSIPAVCGGTPLKPTTPYFASESGLRFAQCRNYLMQYNNGREDVAEAATFIISLTITPSLVNGILSLSLDNTVVRGEGDKYNYKASADRKIDETIYETSPYYITVNDGTGQMTQAQAADLGYNCAPPWSFAPLSVNQNVLWEDFVAGSPNHYWTVSSIKSRREATGRVPFAVDFAGNEEVIVYFKILDGIIGISQWSMGVDTVVKFGGYTNQRMIATTATGDMIGEGGFNNSIPTTVITARLWIEDGYTAPESLIADLVFGRRSDGAISTNTFDWPDDVAVDLAYNSERFSVKHGYRVPRLENRTNDGTTTSFGGYTSKHHIHYTVANQYREIEVCIRWPLSCDEYDLALASKEAAEENDDNIFNSYMDRQLFIYFLDIRDGEPVMVSKFRELDIVDITYYTGSGASRQYEAQGERRERVEIKLPNTDPIKVYIKQSESVSYMGGPVMNGWPFYPVPDRDPSEASTSWDGEPFTGPCPPLSVAEAFGFQNQFRPFNGLSGGQGQFLEHERKYIPTVNTILSHGGAFIIEGEGFTGWADIGDNSTANIQIPACLYEPMQYSSFSWEERYTSYNVKTPEQAEDSAKMPKLSTFYTNSVILDNAAYDIKKRYGGLEQHEEAANSGIKVSVANNGVDRMIAIQYKDEEGNDNYYSYFSATNGPLEAIVPVGINYIPVGVV